VSGEQIGAYDLQANKASGEDPNGVEDVLYRNGRMPRKEVQRRATARIYELKGLLMEHKIGTVYSSNPKGWIFIYVTPQDRYFGHVSQILADYLPVVGDRVSFEVAPPRKPGQLPCAVNVKPDETSTGVQS
jgi:hypothetical protein